MEQLSTIAGSVGASAAASAEELAASVLEIGRQVAQWARIAGQAMLEAEETDCCVTDLSEAAGRIGGVERLISEIAGRTWFLQFRMSFQVRANGQPPSDSGRYAWSAGVVATGS